MDLEESRDLFWIASMLYGAGLACGFAFVWKSSKKAAAFASLLLIFAGFVAHTKGLALRGELVKGCPLGNGMERIQFILWSLVLGYLIIRLLFRLNLLGSFSAGLACLGGVASLAFPSLDSPYWEKQGYDGIFPNHWVELHASVAIFSYGIFGLLAIVSLMYLLQRKSLQSKRAGAVARLLPSIQQLETAGSRLLLIGSVFLTCSIVVGALDWSRAPDALSATKVGLTIGLWLAYCILWFLHFSKRLFGQKFAKVCIFLFFVAICSLGFVRSSTVPVAESSLTSKNDAC